MLSRAKSDELFAEALKWIPGGVNSPVRAFRAVGGNPFFAQRAEGAYVYDVDDNAYVDYVGTWGPAIHGHAFPPVIEAVRSEERRVGKEWRCRWSPWHEKKKVRMV